MHALFAIVAKDLRLLWRDKPALIFLTLAPIVVITVAGFSLANLYGADPTGQTAYEFPLADEDGGALGRALRDHLEHDAAVHLRVVATRDEAAAAVERKQAGTALVIPAGTEAALEHGDAAALLLYSDPVKYLERLNVRLRLLELTHELAGTERDAAAARARAELDRVRAEAERFQRALETTRAESAAAYAQARRAEAEAAERMRAALERSRQDIEAQVRRAAGEAQAEVASAVQRRIEDIRAPARAYVALLESRRADFERWLADLKRLAGSHAAEIPAPPAFPDPPAALTRLLDGTVSLSLPTARPLVLHVALPRLELPPLPTPPVIDLAPPAIPAFPSAPGSLAVHEQNLTGGPLHINTFDQNVPGFSVTFLLLGLLLGVSLGLLDERDWGTFDRVRTLPVAASSMLVGKLLSRFVVGVVQMIVLLAVGWAAFGISLGPQPWALLLPTLGIVFAGCAFGLVVAAVAPSRESVLPVGSIVIVTMAAVGGCWWPIDLEPRWMRQVALAFPTTWAMDAFNDLMIRRRSAAAAWTPLAVMIGYGLLYAVIGLALFRRRLERRAG